MENCNMLHLATLLEERLKWLHEGLRYERHRDLLRPCGCVAEGQETLQIITESTGYIRYNFF